MMEKVYLSEHAIDWILYFFYLFFLYAFFCIILFRFNFRDRYVLLFYSLFYFFYALIPSLDFFKDFVPFFPDTEHYAGYIAGDGVTGQGVTKGLGYRTSSVIFGFVGILSFQKPYVFLSFQIFFYFLSSIFFYDAWRNYSNSEDSKTHLLFVIFYLLYPTALLLIPTTLRESLFILVFSLVIHSIFSTCKGRVLYFAISIAVLILLRFQLAFMVGLFLAAYECYKRLSTGGKVLFTLSSATGLFVILDAIGIKASYFRGLRMWTILRYKSSGLTYGEVDWQNYFDIIQSLPILSLQYLVAPIPVATAINPFNFIGLLVDVFFILILLFFCLINLQFRKYVFWSLFFLALIVIPAGYEYTLSGAARHRMPAILLLIPLAAEGARNLKIGSFRLFV